MQGNLFTSDHLSRIKAGEVAGINAKDFQATGRLDERISRDWSALASAWATFVLKRKAFPEDDFVNTRDYWLAAVFHELGFGRVGKKPRPVAGEKEYPIEYRWENVPIHIVPSGQGLEDSSDDPAYSRPHSILQEYLNSQPDLKWGIVTNGVQWRVLRQNSGSRKPSYVEFNLEAMFEGEHFDEFGIFWRFNHPTRFEGADPWIERWMRESARQGVRALKTLRRGVEDAITALGGGFLRQRHSALSKKLESGALSHDDYYRQVLRLVYRLLFLAVTEDRDLLLVPETDQTRAARRAYVEHYSFRRLRELSRKHKGSKHTDQYEALKVVMRGLKSAEGIPALAIPGLNSALWGPDFLPDLEEATLANRDLLQAVRRLSYIETDGGFQAVDYVNLGAEELGSVYESLLELHPKIDMRERSFVLLGSSGNERKGSGSYYTATALIDEILDHTLEPLLDQVMNREPAERQAALLALKVCDPTCGSGHFLVAAAHRIARRLAQARTGDVEPTPTARRHAMRDVLSHSVYGVDINPMAVELCKVSLWLEAMEPGKPLTFLEHKIQCGNAVIGATPKLLRERIPDAAFEVVEGDDKTACREYRDQNRGQVPAQVTLHGFRGINDPEFLQILREDIRAIENLADDTVTAIHQKERKHEEYQRRQRFAKDYADAWCAAFFQHKQPGDPDIITQETLNLILEDPNLVSPQTWERIEALRKQYRFFHWHLAFPEVFGLPEKGALDHYSGGFDVVLGNPPWDTLSPDLGEFFGRYDADFAKKDKAGQEASMKILLAKTEIEAEWLKYRRELYAAVNFYKNSGRFVLFAPGNLGKGDFNIFRMLVEHGLQTTRLTGYYGQVLPENFYLGANCMALRKEMFERFEIGHLYGFINHNESWFADIDERMKFCILDAKRGGSTTSFLAAFNVRDQDELANIDERHVEFPVTLVREFSPEALQISELDGSLDITIARRMYERCPKFGERSQYYDDSAYMAEVHMGNARDLFHTEGDYPLYEGRMVWHYDHRSKAYVSGRGRSAVWKDLAWGSAEKRIHPQWWIKKSELPSKLTDRVKCYRIGFCDVASPGNERSMTMTIIPPWTVCGDKVPTILLREAWMQAYFIGVANSITMDWLTRSKVSLKLSYNIMDSMPFPNNDKSIPIVREIVQRVARLACTGSEMQGFWEALVKEGVVEPGVPQPIEDVGGRLAVECEIHALVAKHIFSLSREEFEYQFARFAVLQRKDTKEYGDFRTKRLALEAYDRVSNLPITPTSAQLWGPEGGGRKRAGALEDFAESDDE